MGKISALKAIIFGFGRQIYDVSTRNPSVRYWSFRCFILSLSSATYDNLNLIKKPYSRPVMRMKELYRYYSYSTPNKYFSSSWLLQVASFDDLQNSNNCHYFCDCSPTQKYFLSVQDSPDILVRFFLELGTAIETFPCLFCLIGSAI